VQNRYAEISTLHGEFNQSSYLAALDVSETSSGDVSFLKPGKMRWEYRDPEHQIFLTDGESFWYYQEAEAQLLIDTFRGVLTTDVPLAFLAGVGELKRDFSLSSVCREENLLKLELKPRSEAEGLARFVLFVRQDDLTPMGAEIHDGQENVTRVMFSELKVNGSLPSNLFHPAFPKGIDIQDRRD